MTSLLVIQQMYPERANINSIPISYVGRQFFQHQQSSDLEICDLDKSVGYLHLQPRIDAANDKRMIEFSGNLTYTPSGFGSQRIAWSGNVEFDPLLVAKHIHLSITFQGAAQQFLLDITPPTRKMHYIVRVNGAAIDENTISIDENGLNTLLTQAGISPAIFAQFSNGSASQFAPEFLAQQSSVNLNGEIASTFLLTMKIGGQPLIEAHLSQLGQVLKASTPLFGYRLAPHNVAP